MSHKTHPKHEHTTAAQSSALWCADYYGEMVQLTAAESSAIWCAEYLKSQGCK